MNQCASPSVRASFCMFKWQYGGRKNGPSSSTEEQEANFDYQEVWENGRKQYECGSCHRYFTTMRSTLYHLHTMHGKSTTFYGCCLLGFELLKSSIMSKIYRINEMNYH